MTTQRWQKIKTILGRALRLDPRERQGYLRTACRLDPSLYAEFECLLQRCQDHGYLDSFDSLNGERLRQYQLLEKVGRGTVGTVYKARDTDLDRLVIVKVLSPQLVAESVSRQRFCQEARCLSVLDHPNIVTIYELSCDRGLLFIAMEYVPGKMLAERIPSRGIAMGRCLHYAAQIADGLCGAHDAGIIHRDLKPSNVVVSDQGVVKIVDFGLAKAINTRRQDFNRLTLDGTIIGTTGYMSPEQAKSRNADQRADIFSFGAVFYEMLTGIQPFARRSLAETLVAILKEEPLPPAKRLPAWVIEILNGCLEKDPRARFQSMDEVLSRLTTRRAGRLRHPRSAFPELLRM